MGANWLGLAVKDLTKGCAPASKEVLRQLELAVYLTTFISSSNRRWPGPHPARPGQKGQHSKAVGILIHSHSLIMKVPVVRVRHCRISAGTLGRRLTRRSLPESENCSPFPKVAAEIMSR